MTDDEGRRQLRRGYWLRRARERNGITLAAAAEMAGLSAGSGSTVSRWEKGERPIQVIALERLARAYGVPISFLMRPEPTDDERLDEAIQSASDAERSDWVGEDPRDLGSDVGRGVAPRTRSA